MIYYTGNYAAEVTVVLQEDLDSVSRWLNANKLSLNVSKTKVMAFHTSSYRGETAFDLEINGGLLEQVSVFKYLGIILDSKLTFSPRIDNPVAKSCKRINCLCRVIKFVTKDIALLPFKSLVIPYFDYDDIVYQHCSQDLLLRLQGIQNNACRMISLAGRYTSVAAMHLELGLNTLLERRVFHISGFMYKIRNGLIQAEKLVILFEEVEGTHNRDTRSSQRGDLVVLHTRTKYRPVGLYNAAVKFCKVILTRCLLAYIAPLYYFVQWP